MSNPDPPTPALGARNLALLRRIAAAPHLQDGMAHVVTRDLAALLAAYDAQAARLAAVGDALMYAIGIVCNIENPTVTQDVPWEPLRRRFLDQAHAALGPPAAEMAPRVDAGAVGAGEGA